MKLIVNPHKIEIVKNPVNEKEIDITKCEFEFSPEIGVELAKKAFFTLNGGTTYEQLIINNECSYPSEAIDTTGQVEIGVVAYKVENNEYIKRFNPTPAYFTVSQGSLRDAENSSTPTPSEVEQIESAIAELDASKQDNLVSGENIKTINNTSLLGSGNIDLDDITDFITKEVNNLTYYTLANKTGNKIELELNTTNYVMTITLKNEFGTTISTSTIDLPLESVIVNGSYDSTNKQIILYLQNGNTINIPVGDLISGLQAEITPSNKLSSDLVDDTNKTNKFVTTSEKTTWSGKQDALISGTNIKTINNESLLGSGNITIQGGGGTSDYDELSNRPSINTIILTGNKSTTELGLGTITSVKMNGSTISSSGEADLGTVITSHQDISMKQNITDNSLQTTNKTVPTAINEVNSIAKGANQALSYGNYSSMITVFNALDDDAYNVGQNIYINTLEVPDLWISSIESASSTYTYTTDAAFISALETDGYVQIGYYRLSALETQKVDLTNYVENTDYATQTTGGVAKMWTSYNEDNELGLNISTE